MRRWSWIVVVGVVGAAGCQDATATLDLSAAVSCKNAEGVVDAYFVPTEGAGELNSDAGGNAPLAPGVTIVDGGMIVSSQALAARNLTPPDAGSLYFVGAEDKPGLEATDVVRAFPQAGAVIKDLQTSRIPARVVLIDTGFVPWRSLGSQSGERIVGLECLDNTAACILKPAVKQGGRCKEGCRHGTNDMFAAVETAHNDSTFVSIAALSQSTHSARGSLCDLAAALTWVRLHPMRGSGLSTVAVPAVVDSEASGWLCSSSDLDPRHAAIRKALTKSLDVGGTVYLAKGEQIPVVTDDRVAEFQGEWAPACLARHATTSRTTVLTVGTLDWDAEYGFRRNGDSADVLAPGGPMILETGSFAGSSLATAFAASLPMAAHLTPN